MMAALVDWLTGLLILTGAFFTLAAALGIVRLPDFYSRTHAASKAGTLGSCTMLLALAVHIGESSVAMRAIAGVVFFLLTAPISAHLLSRAAYLAGQKLWEGSLVDEMQARREKGEGKPTR